ncbi:protein of unknown function [Hyphomicrobium sp. 1Nfss2.1]
MGRLRYNMKWVVAEWSYVAILTWRRFFSMFLAH